MRQGCDPSPMKQPEAFRQLGRLMHQDIGLEISGLEDMARLLVSWMSPEQRRELRPYIDHLLQTLTPSEMKGVLNRASQYIGFNSKGAASFLTAVAEQLRAQGK